MSNTKGKNSSTLDEIARLAEKVSEEAEEKAKNNTSIKEVPEDNNKSITVKALEVRTNAKVKKKTTSFYLSVNLINDIEAYTKKLNSNKSDVVEEILTNYFKEIRRQNLF